MKILHLFGDWKWTGPAEPTLDLCLGLRERWEEVFLACIAPPNDASQSLAAKARERGLTPITSFHLNKKINIVDNLGDIKKIKQFIDEEAIDIVHLHASHDHLLGGIAARMSRRRPAIVRTNHKGIAMRGDPATRFLINNLTDGYIAFSERGLATDTKNFGLDKSRTLLISPAMRLERYVPPATEWREGKTKYGVESGVVLFGIVARVQRHRRFDILLEGFALALKSNPRLALMIVGRGTHREEVAVKPTEKLGIRNNVIFTGYVGADYLNVLSLFDAMLFLVPGSDGTCRALREGMAMGKPLIAARRGMISEITGDQCALLIDDTPQTVASAILRLADDPALRRRMGSAGRERALARFSIERQTDAIRDFYMVGVGVGVNS